MYVPYRLPVIAAAVLLAGCAGPSSKNSKLRVYDPDKKTGYRFEALELGEDNTDSLFVCLTFSGGGMRAAALAYGVLQELKETEIHDRNGTRRLIDEVDVISAVSGGAFTAMAYGLLEDEIFNGNFEKKFLMHNVQRDLLLTLWKPKHLLRLPSVLLDRIDIAATYYDEEIFDGKTYADLLEKGKRPFIVVNATNVALGDRFEFTQDDFDLLGSALAGNPIADCVDRADHKLEALPVGWAVAASSAFPFLLSPMRLKYYPGEVSSAAIEDVLTTPNGESPAPRRCRWAKRLTPQAPEGEPQDYGIDADAHRYLYLLDGGLSDNLGLAHLLESYQHGVIGRMVDDGVITKLIVIIVNAHAELPEDLESKSSAPGLLTVGYKTGTTSMHRLSSTLADVARFFLAEEPCKDTLEAYVITVNLPDGRDTEKTTNFLPRIPGFFLPRKEVKRLIELGGSQLRKSKDFEKLVLSLSKTKPNSPK